MSFGPPHHYMDEREARELHAAYGQPSDSMMDNGPPVHMPPMGTNPGHFSDSYERMHERTAGPGGAGGYHLVEPANKKQRVYEPLSEMLYTNDPSYPSSIPMSSTSAGAYGMPNQYGGFSPQTYPSMGNSPAAPMSGGQPTETELRLALTCQVMVKQIRDLHAALADMRQRSLFLASQVDQLRGELSYFHNVVSAQPTPSSAVLPPAPIASVSGPGLTPTGRMPPSAPMPSSVKNESKEAPRKRGRPRLANAFCSMCGATQTPQWRKHNDQRMCNACGLLHRDRGHRPPGSGANSPPPLGPSGPTPLLTTTASLPGGINMVPAELIGKGKKDKTHHSLSYPPLDRDKINAALTLQYSKPPFVQSGSMTPSPASNKSDSTSGSSVSSLPNRLGSIPLSVPSSTVSSAAPSHSAMRPLNGSFPMSDRSAFSRSNTRSVSSVDSDAVDKMSVLSGSSTPSPASSIHSASASQFMSAIASSTAISNSNGTASTAQSLPSAGSRPGSLAQLSSISSPPSRPTLPPVQLLDLQSASSALPPLAPNADLKGTLPFPFQMYVSNQLPDSASKQGGTRPELAGNSTEKPVEAVSQLSKVGPPADSRGSRQLTSESTLSKEEEEYDEGDLLLEEGDYVSSEEENGDSEDDEDAEDDMDG
eukprot:GILK01007110.1.p1 GENE.GILK01007110.1~~GILK01007110.1.p1  ORF type:complete len:649 (-),score=101.25 GILK01007110.1:279-2225(-)